MEAPLAGSPVSTAERDRRVLALRSALERDGFDALVAYATPDAPGRVAYLTGYEPIFCDAWCVVTADRVVLLAPPIEYAHTDGDAWLPREDIDRTDDPIAAIERLLGPRARRVALAGIELLPLRLGVPLGAHEPDGRFAASDALDRVRMLKSAAEVELIRAASRIVDAGTAAFIDGVRERAATEVELAAAVEAAMRREGLERLWFSTVLGSGPRSLDLTAQPRLVPLVPGAMVLFDNAARVHGYCADVARADVVGGEPTAEQLRLLETVREMYDGVRALLRPGADARAVHRRAVEIAAEAGYEYVHATGHGIGTDVHEQPEIGRRLDAELAEGMVVAVEPGLYVEGVGGARLENTIWITDAGPVDLTVAPTVLW